MRISAVQIENYKSFNHALVCDFKPGINIIIGENNTGKTTLIEALGLKFRDKPHYSLKTYQPPYLIPNSISRIQLKIAISQEELLNALRAISPFWFSPTANASRPDDLLSTLRDDNELILNFTGAEQEGKDCKLAESYLQQWGGENSQSQYIDLRFDGEKIFKSKENRGRNRDQSLIEKLAKLVRNSIYAFKSERYSLGVSKSGKNEILEPNGANLAEVLSVLQSHPAKWKDLNYYARLIFPQIYAVSVRPTDSDKSTVLIWNSDPVNMPKELAVSLTESGTGIGQVLCVLYVLLSADYPKTIIIDEPQSFLHPKALRTLCEILADFPQHQFIISTHAPAVITASQPNCIYQAVLSNCETQIRQLDVSNNESVRVFLTDIGVRFSDVFGAEQILWVDGATEELCFPEMLKVLGKDRYYGTKILGVKQTGDFEGRYSKTIFEIYQRLSQGEGILPPAIGFLFDRESRTPQDLEDLRRQAKGSVDFLDRRMFENYLLIPSAIAQVMNGLEGFRDASISQVEIDNWINRHKNNSRYISKEFADSEFGVWIKEVNAAKLLSDLFQELSEGRFSYDKLEHGLKLVREILKNHENDLHEVTEKIEHLLGRGAFLGTSKRARDINQDISHPI